MKIAIISSVYEQTPPLRWNRKSIRLFGKGT